MNSELLNTFLVSILGFAGFFVLMAVGVIFSNKVLKGSCGGLGKAMGLKCMFCAVKECKDSNKTVEETPQT